MILTDLEKLSTVVDIFFAQIIFFCQKNIVILHRVLRPAIQSPEGRPIANTQSPIANRQSPISTTQTQ